MRLTNNFNLPKVLVNAMHRDPYTKGAAHLSVTELINSPRIVQLMKNHYDEIEVDVSDRIFALLGTAVHYMLERGKDKDSVTEERLRFEVDGWVLSGAIDLQETNEDGIDIMDYKVTSVYAVMNEKPEWEEQLNVYAWLVENVKKVKVNKLKIVAILKDWRKRDRFKEGYPASACATVDIPLWSEEKRSEFIKTAISKHSEALFNSELGAELPLCTPVQMWEKPTTYAVKKIGGKRATAVFESKEAAEKKLAESGDKFEMEVRKGERTRCAEYCLVNQFCSQYKQYLKEQEDE